MEITLFNRVYTAEFIKIISDNSHKIFLDLEKIDFLQIVCENKYTVDNRTIILRKYFLKHTESFYRNFTIVPKSLREHSSYLYDIYIGVLGDYVFISAPFKGVAEFLFGYLDTFLKTGKGDIAWEYTKIKSNPFLLTLGEKAQLKIKNEKVFFYLTYCQLEYIFLNDIKTIKQIIQLQCKELGKSPQYQNLIKELKYLEDSRAIDRELHETIDISLISLKFKCRIEGFSYITCFTDRFGNFKYRVGKNAEGIINLISCLVNLYEETDLDMLITNLPIHSLENTNIEEEDMIEKY